MTPADWVELIKAVGGALGVIIGAISLAYARIAAVASKRAEQQTVTTEYVDGRLYRKSSAVTAEETVHKVDALQNGFDTVLGRLMKLEAREHARTAQKEEPHEAL